jgi:hypothetical protein
VVEQNISENAPLPCRAETPSPATTTREVKRFTDSSSIFCSFSQKVLRSGPVGEGVGWRSVGAKKLVTEKCKPIIIVFFAGVSDVKS